MKILLDTHIFLWYISGDNRISPEMTQMIRRSENEVYLSVVSLWEVIIKHQLGKMPLPQSPEIYLPTQRQRHMFRSLEVDEASVKQLMQLQPLHNDPFDRLLICQALAHGMTIATIDNHIVAYPVSTL
jgi:PIN domain nuclease of toxin-antitoxin system